MTEALSAASTNSRTGGFSADPRCWGTGASSTFEKVAAVTKKVANRIRTAGPADGYDSDEPSPNTTKLLLESHTSTDGSESPKLRWTRGPPPTLDDAEPATIRAGSTILRAASSAEKDSSPSPQSLRSGRASRSTSDVKSYVAWAWLLEDEGGSEPRLQKPNEGEAVALPQLTDAERELLCQKTRLRLLEVGRQCPDVPALVEEYLRFTFLRQRLDGLLTLEPSALVNDVWDAHAASGREYAAFCERAFSAQPVESEVLHGETQSSPPVLYQNTFEAYEYFFDTCPPVESWPAGQSVRAEDMVKDEEAAVKVNSPCRRSALVRTA
ncbi:unnamed protein product [Scytosiphon promiscuus]